MEPRSSRSRPRRNPEPRRTVAAVVLSVLLAPALAACSDEEQPPGSTVTATAGVTDPPPDTSTPSTDPGPVSGDPQGTTPVVTGLTTPWGLGFLPDGSALVTERDTGRLLHLVERGERWRSRVVGTVEAESGGESGLLGVAVSPTFDEDSEVFLYLTTREDNRVVTVRFDGEATSAPEPVLTGIPSSFLHDGGRMAFGPDGHLYVSTGDATQPDLAQDRDSLAGKILRITPDGDPAPGNPWDSPVYSMGHRNVQGLAFDDEGRLWATEFGDSTWDELNLISAGGNYGWPVMEGNEGRDDEAFTAPAAVWNPAENSPSGLAFRDGVLWSGALRGTRLWGTALDLKGGVQPPRDWFVGDLGRIRTVSTAPDGSLWITTSNTDGRAEPGPRDDRVLRVEFD